MSRVSQTQLPSQVVLYGGTGQAKVLRPIIEHLGSRVVMVIDDTPNLASPFTDVPIIQGWDRFLSTFAGADRTKTGFCVTIGNPHGRVRLRLHQQFTDQGFIPLTVIHPQAWVAENAQVGPGSQILAGAIVCAEARIGTQCIVNTRAGIDHEDILEDGSEVAPGATLCGLVRLGINAWVCAGATVLPRISIGQDSIVGAGAVVRENVPDNTTVVGVPARILYRNQ